MGVELFGSSPYPTTTKEEDHCWLAVCFGIVSIWEKAMEIELMPIDLFIEMHRGLCSRQVKGYKKESGKDCLDPMHGRFQRFLMTEATYFGFRLVGTGAFTRLRHE